MAPTPTDVATPRARGRGLLPRLADSDLAALIVATAVAVAVGWPLTQMPDRAPELTLQNPTRYELAVALADDADGAWVPLVVVRPGETRELRDVPDQGEQWVFRFRSQGRAGGQLAFSAGELEEMGHEVRIPEEVGARLEAAGAPLLQEPPALGQPPDDTGTSGSGEPDAGGGDADEDASGAPANG